jgi:hypothetical protein
MPRLLSHLVTNDQINSSRVDFIDLGIIRRRFESNPPPKWGCGANKFGPYRFGRSRVADWCLGLTSVNLGLASADLG